MSNRIQLAGKLLARMTGQASEGNRIPEAWNQPLVSGANWTTPTTLVIKLLNLSISANDLLKQLAEVADPVAVVSRQLLHALTKINWAPGQQAPHEWYSPIIEGGEITPLSMIAIKLGLTGAEVLKSLGVKDGNKRRNPVYKDLDLFREALLAMEKISGVNIRDPKAIEIYNLPLAVDPKTHQSITLFSLMAAALGLDDDQLYTLIFEHPDFAFLVEELEYFSGENWNPSQDRAPEQWFKRLDRKDPYPGRSLLETISAQYKPSRDSDQWMKIFDATYQGMAGRSYRIPDHKKVGLGKSWLKGRKRPETLVDPLALGLLLDHITSAQHTITLNTATKLLDDLGILNDLNALEKRNTTRKVYIQNLINREYLLPIGKTGDPPELTYEWSGNKDESKGRDPLRARGGALIWEYKSVEDRGSPPSEAIISEVSPGLKVELESNEPEPEPEAPVPIEEVLETYTYVPYEPPTKEPVKSASSGLNGWTATRKPKVMIIGGEQGERQTQGHEEWLQKYFDYRGVNIGVNEGKQSTINKVKNFAPDLLIIMSGFVDKKATSALQDVVGPIIVSSINQKSLKSVNMAYESLKMSGRASWFIDAYDRSN